MNVSAVVSRRQLIQLAVAGCAGLPVSAILASGPPSPATARARACILLYMDGGASHIDLWDMKPDAPTEIRGPFEPIATTADGIRICEHLPLMARQMHLVTLVRSVCHQETVHDPAVYQMLTGRKHLSSAGNLEVQPTDFPQIGAAFGRVDRHPAVMPKVIQVPESMQMGSRTLPGQNAGFLGRSYDPFHVDVSRDRAEVIRPALSLPPEVRAGRFARWRGLVGELNGSFSTALNDEDVDRFREYHNQALDLVQASRVQEAFDLDHETEQVRACYGRDRHGQSVLLARRLVEAGARFVTVYWGREPQDWADGRGEQLANNPWDTHRNHFPLVRDNLLPRADRALSALLSDLDERGELEDTLVVWMGDFGRTPRISKPWASRDHWPHAFSILLAGAGLPRGMAYGATDRQGAIVTDHPVSPADLTATIFTLMGVDPRSPIRGPEGKEYAISSSRPIEAFLDARDLGNAQHNKVLAGSLHHPPAAVPACRALKAAAIASVPAESADSVLYEENFSRTAYGGTPNGWRDLANVRPSRNWAVDGNGFLRQVIKNKTILPLQDKVGRSNDVHYQPEGYEVLATAVAASIEAALRSTKK